MFKAHIVEINATAVGLAVGDEREVVFYSAGGRFDAIDGSRYNDLVALNRAVRRHARQAPLSPAGDGRVRLMGPTAHANEPAESRLAA